MRALSVTDEFERPSSEHESRQASAVADDPPQRPNAGPPQPAARLTRIEKLLEEIRSVLVGDSRERGHRDFSVGWLAGSILQVVVIGLLAMALLDWILMSPEDPATPILIKLAFAAVLQLIALTSFILSRAPK